MLRRPRNNPPGPLVYPVFEGNFVIDFKRINTADLDHDDDKISIPNGLLSIQRCPGRAGQSVFLEHPVGKGFHAP